MKVILKYEFGGTDDLFDLLDFLCPDPEDLLEEEQEKKCCKHEHCCCKHHEQKCCHKHNENGFCEETPKQPWFVNECEPKEDPNKIFGAGFEVDEPRREDYESRAEFLKDHALYDEFVTVGEKCEKAGIIKKSDAPITKVEAIRRPVEAGPPMNVNLVGETHWWER